MGMGVGVGDALGPAGSGKGEAVLDPGLRARPVGLPLGLPGPASDPSWPSRSRGWGARSDPAQAAAGSPGLGAAGGADGAERSAAGGGVGGGGWSREVRRVCGAFLYLLPGSPAAVPPPPPTPPVRPPSPHPGTGLRVQRAGRRRSQHVGGQEAEDGRLRGARLPLPSNRVAPNLPGHRDPTLPERRQPRRGGWGAGRRGKRRGKRRAGRREAGERARPGFPGQPSPAGAPSLWEPPRRGVVTPRLDLRSLQRRSRPRGRTLLGRVLSPQELLQAAFPSGRWRAGGGPSCPLLPGLASGCVPATVIGTLSIDPSRHGL